MRVLRPRPPSLRPPPRSPARAPARPRSAPLPPRAGLLDGLFGGGSSARTPPRPSTPPAARKLVTDLLTLVADTDAGGTADDEMREAAATLAASLRRYGGRAPAQSPSLFGTYRVAYCSNPQAPGGPVLRSAPGRVLAQDQAPTQTLTEDGRIINAVSFKALGLVSRTTTQTGPLTITGPASYRVVLDGATRNFDVLYVDDRVRVVEFVPSDGRAKQLFVFERVQDEEEEEEEAFECEEEDEEEEAAMAPPPGRGGGLDLASFFVKPSESLATVVERDAAARDRKAGATPPPAKARAAARPVARARAAPAPRAAPPPRDAARSLVARLADDAKTATAAARDAVADLKAATAAAAPTLRASAPARAAVDAADAEAAAAADALVAARAAEAEAVTRAKQAALALKEADARVKALTGGR